MFVKKNVVEKGGGSKGKEEVFIEKSRKFGPYFETLQFVSALLISSYHIMLRLGGYENIQWLYSVF